MVLVGGPDDFVAYHMGTGEVSGYPAERIATIKRQNAEDGLIFPVLRSDVDVQLLPGIPLRRFSTTRAIINGTVV